MQMSEPLLDCAEVLTQRGLSSIAIFILESSKPCFGLFREGLSAVLPMINLFVREGRLIKALQDLKTAEDVECFIKILEQKGAQVR